jgi:2-phospho-L-lactate/phosphoenolpyruvate guanylyltransferase
MTIWAIVPVKPLRLGKSRLSGVLSDDERAVLNRMFLEQTLDVLRSTPIVTQTLVVSRDPAALAIAREFGARTVLEDGTPNLNSALNRATMLAKNYATRGVLVLPADLPLLTQADLFEFFKHVCEPPCMVITPDRHETGTNALLMAPGGLVPYDFGIGSFTRHCESAKKLGAKLEIVRNKHIELDLDTPDDLALLKQIEQSKPQGV